MWDDIIIGKGERRSSAVLCYKSKDGKFSFSENNISYWISDLIFGMGMTVYKDTPEGQRITKLITNANPNDNKIKQYLDLLVVKHLPYGRLLIAIENLKQESFEEGRESKAAEIRHLLGITEY